MRSTARRRIQRVFAERGAAITVETVHPQHGLLTRGRITPIPGTVDGWRWSDTDSHAGEVHGDYLDAERSLLAATAGLDELDPEGDHR